MYNSVLRGYLNYYSFTHNYNRVASSLTHLLRESCARLLAAKFTLRNRAQVFKSYGQDLRGKDKAGFLKPDLKLKPWDFKTNAPKEGVSLHSLRDAPIRGFVGKPHLCQVRDQRASGNAPGTKYE
ncbi:hypothetical protein L211DRAFT_854677 [Terfezia boudieri ATCC MYA-4762]|uniref:Domain X domain-containing protein n=1 Tax=Terfezia boudieri ATCC MYA-4762 TaxID=1051890 RepID=A0A3N4L4T8_9PEZI|nr:hypothetical protein L211DRAFT_854677 [Terfezia boudieri ATCC MYA-4762]